MSSQVSTIKDRLSIVDVLSGYIELMPSGSNYKARCPFHNEKTPSFYVSTERNSYYCFGCGAKGDIFSFVQNFEGSDFVGALKLLADKAGVVLVNDYSKNENKDDYTHLYQILEDATLFFEEKLSDTKEAQIYLSDRGLYNKTIESFRIGYAPNTWRSVSDYLIKKGYSVSDIEKVGLIKINGDKFYDRFRSRIIFPISDSSGRIIAFSGRTFLLKNETIEGDQEVAKYLNSPDTVLFNKSNVFFGIDRAKLAIRSRGYSIIVEGQMDLVLSHQAGFINTIATSGTAFTSSVNTDENTVNNLGLVKRLSKNIIFAFDGDNAGIRAVNRAAIIAFSLDMQVKVTVMPDKKDPADIIKENPDNWKEIIRNAKNIISFNLDLICDENTDQRIRGKKVREIIFPFLILVASEIEKVSYINEISSKTSLPSSAIMTDFDNYQKTYKEKNENEKIDLVEKITLSRKDHIYKRLFSLVFLQESHGQTADYKKVSDLIGKDEFEKLYTVYSLQKDELSFEAQIWYNDKHISLLKEYDSILENLEEELLNEKIPALLSLISIKEKSKDTESLQEIVLDYQKTIGRIESIKNKRAQI